MKLFILISQVTLIGGQCMRTFSMPNKCRRPNPSFEGNINNTGLDVCLDHCLANTVGTCKYMHWIPSTRQCELFIHTPPQERVVDCVISFKSECSYIPGEKCFKEDLGPTHTTDHFPAVRRQALCRTLCRFHPHCSSYLWNTHNQDCRIQTRTGTQPSERHAGDVWMRKKYLCPGSPCALLRIGVAGDASRVSSSDSLFACIKKGLDSKQVYGVQWNYLDHTCWFQYVKPSTSYVYSRYETDRYLLDVIQSRPCNEGPPPSERYFRKEENMKMPGGHYLDIESEKRCVELCKQLGNCGAVSWASVLRRNKCILHQLEKPLIAGDGHVTYRPCQRTVPGHRDLVTSYFTSREKFIPWKRSTQHAIHLLECAFKCRRTTCNSFTLMDRDRPICTVSERSTHQFVRK